MAKFEIYESLKGKKKKYIVCVTPSKVSVNELVNYAKQFFKCSEAHIALMPGWIYKGELYLEDPKKNGERSAFVACWRA